MVSASPIARAGFGDRAPFTNVSGTFVAWWCARPSTACGVSRNCTRTSAARNVLGDRLAKLVEHGVLAKEPYVAEGQRERFEDRLTDKGRELFPVIVSRETDSDVGHHEVHPALFA